MPHDAIRHWKSTGKTCTFSEYLDLIAPAQEEYTRKCTDGLTASAAHWAVNHQEAWPYGLRDFTLGEVSFWDLDDVMDSKSYEEMPQKCWTSSAPRSMRRSVSGGHLGNPLLWKAWTRPASRQRSEDRDTKAPGQPLP